MSTAKLKATRDQIVAGNIGLYLPVVKTLIAAIDEHITEDNSVSNVGTVTVDVTQVPALQKQISDAHELITELQKQHTQEIDKLQQELAEAKKLQVVQVEQSVLDEAVAYEQEHGIEPKPGK